MYSENNFQISLFLRLTIFLFGFLIIHLSCASDWPTYQHDNSRSGVAGVYNRAEYRAAKKTVLQAWSDLVEEAVSGG